MTKELFDTATKKRIQKLAKENRYDYAEYLIDWNGYKVFRMCFKDNKFRAIGSPRFILLEPDGKIRMTTYEEGMAINDLFV